MNSHGKVRETFLWTANYENVDKLQKLLILGGSILGKEKCQGKLEKSLVRHHVRIIRYPEGKSGI